MANEKWKMTYGKWFCFSPHPPSQSSCGVAKLVRHRIVNPVIEGSNPSATAKSLPIANFRFAIGSFMKLILLSEIPIGNQKSEIENLADPELE
jgi:hypothetical protein